MSLVATEESMYPLITIDRSTGWVWLIRSHSLAGFSFELSANLNYNINVLLYPLMFDKVISRLRKKFELTGINWFNCQNHMFFFMINSIIS